MRLVIGEDNVLFREGLALLLADAGHEIVAKAADAPALLTAVEGSDPDLVIIDVRMPPDRTDDGARAARVLRGRHPELGILMLSQNVETRQSVELVASGRFGYLLKDRVLEVDDFLDALTRVARGGSVLDPEVVRRLIGAGPRRTALDELTQRERGILAMMAEGHTNATIARRLVISERTVETHVSSIMAKLGLEHDTQGHRRILAVLTYLRTRSDVPPTVSPDSSSTGSTSAT